jgi:hypothetical protein
LVYLLLKEFLELRSAIPYLVIAHFVNLANLQSVIRF